jgi:hypothetical protein
MDSELKIRDKEIETLKNSIVDIKEDKKSNKNNLPVWLALVPSIAAVILGIISLYK